MRLTAVSISNAKVNLPEYVDQVRMSPSAAIEIRRYKKDAAVLMSKARFRELQAVEDTMKALKLRAALRARLTPLEKVLAGLELEL